MGNYVDLLGVMRLQRGEGKKKELEVHYSPLLEVLDAFNLFRGIAHHLGK